MPEAILGSQEFTILYRLIFAQMLRLVTSINMCVVINLVVFIPTLSKIGSLTSSMSSAKDSSHTGLSDLDTVRDLYTHLVPILNLT